jgi:hypothetical protein
MNHRWTIGIVFGALALGALVGIFPAFMDSDSAPVHEAEKQPLVQNFTRDTFLRARDPSTASNQAGPNLSGPSQAGLGSGEFKNTEWGSTCAAVDAKERSRRDQRLDSLLSNSAGPELIDPFSGTISSLYVEYRQDGRWHQLRLAVADADAAQQTASYRFVLSARTGPSEDSPLQSVPLTKGLEGRFDQEAAKELWNTSLAQLKSNAAIEIITIRSRSFARFFDGEAVEIENDRVAVYDDNSFQCIGQGDGLPFRCSCTPDFASLD